MALQATLKDTTFQVGDTVEIYQKIKEKDKERTQVFKGLVISISGHSVNKSFMVRRIAAGAIGVERIWPLNSPWISKVKVIKKGKVKRAKLYYLRERKGKGAMRVKIVVRVKSKEDKSEKEKPGQARGKSGGKVSSKE